MKKLIISTLAIISGITLYCCNRNANAVSAKDTITFYDVPLVCNADTQIGCGSRSKPALLELEKNPAVKGAWLNRQGTVLAIVWQGSPQTEAVAKPIFDKNGIGFNMANADESKEYMETFGKEGLWYKGADVDKLSVEEAGVTANRYVSLAVEQKWITPDEGKSIESDLENYLKTELVKIRTPEELENDSQHKIRQGAIAIFEKHIGKERTDTIIKAYNQWQQECNKQEDCCKKDASKAQCN